MNCETVITKLSCNILTEGCHGDADSVMSQALGSDSEPEIELGNGSDAEFDTARGWGKKGRGGGGGG